MVTRVGDYTLVEYDGLWFLERDGRTVSTIVDMGDGRWQARTPEGSARTLHVPPDAEDPARYVAEQIT